MKDRDFPLTVRYAFDHRLQELANASGSNYWYAYVEEILSRLGVCACPLPLAACADADELAPVGVLFLGDFRQSDMPSGSAETLARWVQTGGILIGFAAEGLDDLFGIAGEETIAQDEDPFSISGYFELQPSSVTQECRAPVDPHQRLIIISPIRRVRGAGCEPLARLFRCHPAHRGDGTHAREIDAPAITHRRLGAGHAFYFTFDVAQTMWAIQQGRPVDQDYDGDGYLRRSDASVIGANSRAVPYADSLHFLLANMIGRAPVPMIHQIPPRRGAVAPALLYFGGDDECEPGIQAPASDFMVARNLPYHINLMSLDGRFAIGPDEQARIEANGHELALHYDFITGFEHPCGFTREDVLAQARLFRQAFGRDSVCGVTHYCRWTGWSDPARWMREAGGLADNSFFGWTSPPTNPVNTIGFVHGSAFPRYLWDDAERGNVRLDFLELPITAYEVGYEGDDFIPEKVHEALELAVRYHLTLEFFYHPIYIARYPACRRAIDELVRCIQKLPAPPVLMGPDQLCRWWRSRSGATIRSARQVEGRICFEGECDYADGFVVKIPTGESSATDCTVDEEPAPCESAFESGQHWTFIPLGPGRHRVEVRLLPTMMST